MIIIFLSVLAAVVPNFVEPATPLNAKGGSSTSLDHDYDYGLNMVDVSQ